MGERKAVITGVGEIPNTRHPLPGQDAYSVLSHVVGAALADAELTVGDVDGIALTSMFLPPDRAGDLGWRFGMSTRWLVDGAPNGASSIANLALAARAVETGDASVVVVVSGDAPDPVRSAAILGSFNLARDRHLAPLGYSGPNSLFAMLTTRQMRSLGLTREDYGHLVTAQRRWAHDNDIAVYRELITLEDYLSAPLIADPLGMLDCPPPVVGGSALIVTTEDRRPAGRRAVRVRAAAQAYNFDHQESDGLRTGLSVAGPRLWETSGMTAADIDVACFYDDYPAVVIAQLIDLGFTSAPEVSSFLRDRVASRDFPLNTSGGLLSAGQAAGGGGLLGTTEIVKQLLGRGGARQVADAQLGIATGYGQVLYRHGSASTIALLEGVS